MNTSTLTQAHKLLSEANDALLAASTLLCGESLTQQETDDLRVTTEDIRRNLHNLGMTIMTCRLKGSWPPS